MKQKNIWSLVYAFFVGIYAQDVAIQIRQDNAFSSAVAMFFVCFFGVLAYINQELMGEGKKKR